MIRTLCILLISSLVLSAQENPTEDPAHQQLRDLRTEMIAAIESRDIDRMMTYVHPEIVTTWQDGETTRGVDELRAYYDRLGKDAFVAFKVPHKPDDLSILQGGDTAISNGIVVANYKILGKDYEFTSRWTATLSLVDGQWKVIAYHVSLNALDNPVIDAAKSFIWMAAGIGILIGLLIGFLLCLFRKRKAG